MMTATLIGLASCTKQTPVPETDSQKVSAPAPLPQALPAMPPSESKSESESQVPTGETVKEKAVTVEIKKPAVTDWLAKLDSIQNRVEFRQRNESIWKPPELGMFFVRFDALQTQNQSSAKIVYQSGSNLDVGNNTLLIFDHDPGKKKKHEDRVIVKNGELIGTTKTELWVFTNAGLVQIKPEAKSKVAKAKISVQDDQKIKVKVDTGTADVVFKGKDDFEKIHVAPKSDVEITSSVKLIDTNNTVATAKIEAITAAVEKPMKFVKAELSVEQPVDGAVTTDTEIEAKGRLSAAGGKLLINGELTELKDDFSFIKKIKLQPGSNLIVFQVVRSDASVQFMRKTIRLQAGQ